jgi:hypothetical protein
MSGNFYYKLKFFDSEDEFFTYVKAWPKAMLCEESLTIMLDRLKKDILCNLNLDLEIRNGDMDILLQKTFFESMKLRNTK